MPSVFGPPALVAFAVLVGCGGGPEGELLALTYNVAGLPEGLSRSDPARNTPLISPKLNAYDLVLVQEDFTYHDLLIASVTHPYRSLTKVPETRLTGDGLNRLSRSPFVGFERFQWRSCHGGLDSGSDCLAEKGFTVATHQFGDDRELEIDVYNLHMDAGGGEQDGAARSDQVEQLLETLTVRSAGRAVIVGGDTNLRVSREGDAARLARLMGGAALADSCEAVSCPDPTHIDRFFLRSGDAVELEAVEWSEDRSFVDDVGEDLSDHPAIAVRFRYRAR